MDTSSGKTWLQGLKDDLLALFSSRFVIVASLYVSLYMVVNILELPASHGGPLAQVTLYVLRAPLCVHVAILAKRLMDVPQWMERALAAILYVLIAGYTVKDIVVVILKG